MASDASPARRRPPAWLVLTGLALALLLALAVAGAIGATTIPLWTLAQILLNRIGLAHGPVTWSPQDEAILLTFRLPRAVAAACVGAALATSGALFQGLLRNPLADPYVVGSSGGAALGAVLGMLVGGKIAFLGFGLVPLGAFLGAVTATLLVISLAGVGGRLPVVSVLLAGFVVSSLLAYAVSLLLVISDRLQLALPQVYAWLLGGVSVTGWGQVAVIGPLVVGSVVASLGLARPLNAFSLGEEGAARLGVDVERSKLFILLGGALLTAAAVSVSGLVGFVGLIVPHLVRLTSGPDHRLLLPASALGGAVFLVLADLLARTVLSPNELPLGILTAFLGGPFFLWLLRRTRKEYQW
jgi:iron complex transport system permease protein